uniref:BED-type domain-containing protein n=1 Tax=Romanomermis culicivorax TaxID=13658 RepID=A0A915I3Z3_ROMCU
MQCTDAIVSTASSISSTDQSESCSISKRANPFFAGGRRQSFIWRLFTDADSPHKLKVAVCKHCKMLRKYHKKSENVLRHLLQCNGFRKYARSLDDCDVPESCTGNISVSSENGSNKDRRNAMYDQIRDYTTAANIEKQRKSWKFKVLIEGKKSRLEYWLTDGAGWPLLQEIAVELLSPSLSSTSNEIRSRSSFNAIHSKLRDLLSDDTINKLVFVKMDL